MTALTMGRHVDGWQALAAGEIAGDQGVNKFGCATNVDTNDCDIWDRANTSHNQPIWLPPTVARVHNIVSTDAGDTLLGAGARTLVVDGLTSWSSQEVSEEIEMDGLGTVATANAYVICHRMRVKTKGGDPPNIGTITATAVTDGTVTAQIQPGNGQTLMAIYGVPSLYTAYLTRYYASFIKVTSNAAATLNLLMNPEPDVERLGYLRKHVQGLQSNGTSYLPYEPKPPIPFPGPCLIKLQAVGGSMNLVIGGGFDLMLRSN